MLVFSKTFDKLSRCAVSSTGAVPKLTRPACQTLHAGGEDVTPGFFEDKRLGSVTVFHPQDAILRIPSDVEAPADDVEAAVWDRLETDLVEHDGAESNGKSPAKLNVVRAGNVAIVGEAFHLELRAVNPLETPLRVAQIRLEAKSLDETPLEGALSVDDVPDLELGPREARRVRCFGVLNTSSLTNVPPSYSSRSAAPLKSPSRSATFRTASTDSWRRPTRSSGAALASQPRKSTG